MPYLVRTAGEVLNIGGPDEPMSSIRVICDHAPRATGPIGGVPADFEYDEEVTTIRRMPTRYEAGNRKRYGWTEYATTLR